MQYKWYIPGIIFIGYGLYYFEKFRKKNINHVNIFGKNLSVIIDEQEYSAKNSILIRNNKIIVDGIEVDLYDPCQQQYTVHISGDVLNTISATGNVEVNGNCNNITSTGPVVVRGGCSGDINTTGFVVA